MINPYRNLAIEELRQRITPLWHLEPSHIKWSNQKHGINYGLQYENAPFHIYSSSWKELIKAMDRCAGNLLKGDKLWTKHQHKENIINVLKHWEKEEALIPPQSNPLIPPQEVVQIGEDANHYLKVADGNHRLKVASILQPEKAIFILYDQDLTTINKYFNPELVK